MVDDACRLAWIALAQTPGLGPCLAARLLEHHGGDVVASVRAGPAVFRGLFGGVRGPRLRKALGAARPSALIDAAYRVEQRLLTPVDGAWPRRAFQALSDPPLALFLRGRLPPSGTPTVGIVGTRDAGPYGRRVARRLSRALAAQGLWIISGLALGIDGEAHRAALVAGGGGTAAVLGCGVDVPYPQEHTMLAEEIAEGGALLSEYPPGTMPQKGHFPRRNRIVAALSDALVVVEAPARSGALITAGLALEMGREILVVPGPIGGSTFSGSHRLLKRGTAALCDGPGDVLEALGLGPPPAGSAAAAEVPTRRPEGGPALALFSAIDETEVVDVSELCRRTGLGVSDVATAIARLEVDGYLARVPGLGVRRL